MKIKELIAKSVLSRSQVYEYALNPYVGCAHNCAYCYARFMKKFTGHKEKWGEFVDVKINAPELLAHEIKRKRVGRVWVSGVCDPYQPLEKRYMITKRCVEILTEHGWPLTVQTKSPLVMRDVETLKKARDCEVGFSLATADEKIRRIFEPGAPPLEERIEALGILHSQGIQTFAMIAPLLPGAEDLVAALKGKVTYVILDKLNYHHADWVFKRYGLPHAGADGFFLKREKELTVGFAREGIPCQVVYNSSGN
jgi:DNA repair photolyase